MGNSQSGHGAAAEPTAGLESRYTTVRGREIHARISVDAPNCGYPPVVFVHGLVVSSRYLVPTAERLAPFARVYLPDLPGYGKSVKPRRVLDVPELADALADWMGAVGLERAALIANSFGCQIAADFAARYPERAERLVLLGPTVDPRARDPLRLGARWLLNVPLEPPSLDFVFARDLLDMGLPRTLGTMRVMFRDRIEQKLPRVRAPTLVVRGGRDSTVPQRWAEEVVGLLPHGRLAVIPGAPHTINYNSPAEVVRLVRAFLAEEPLDAAAGPSP